MKPRTSSIAVLTVSLVSNVAMAAPEYLIDARGWDGRTQARLVARAVPELTRDEAWSGKVEVEAGELLEVRVRSREGRRSHSRGTLLLPGMTLDDAAFEVEAGQPMHDLAIEFEGEAQTVIRITLAGESVSATVGELLEDDRQFRLEGGGSVRLLLTFVYPPDEPAPITKLKPLYPRTELLVGAKAQCVIAVPADGRHDALAGELAKALGDRGAAPEVVKAEDLMDERLQPNAQALSRTHLIAIGNVLDNHLLGGLWGRGYALASALYPGPEGYVIRTIHDPFGLGRNVLLLAGSDASGVAKAVAKFIEAYVRAGTGDLILEAPVVECDYHAVDYPSVPDPWPKYMPQHRDMDYFREVCVGNGTMDANGNAIAVEGEAVAVVAAVVSSVGRIADAWWYLGSEELPGLMAEMFEKNLAAFEAYEAPPPAGMHGGIATFARTWDLIEELPVFSDRVRLAVTNALLSAARQGHERMGMHTLIREGCRQIHHQNHGTYSAVHSFDAWQYFYKYYDLPEAEYWVQMADALFRGQAGSFQIPEDATGYMAYCPNHSIGFALLRPEMEYLERGIAREHADYLLLASINNLGLYTGFGDAPGLVPVSDFPVLARALWYYRDGRYRWVLENVLHRNSGLRAYGSRVAIRDDVDPVEPVDMTGICVQPIYERPVESGAGRLEPVYLPREPIADGRFNKVCLREAWGRDKQCLVLSGMKRDGHTQHDVNCLVNFTDNGKVWLVDHEYGLRRPADHSGIVGMQDGRWSDPGAQAFVQQRADFDRTGLLRTSVGLRSLTWQRNILWLKGRWFIVLDDLTAEEGAEYFLRASWRGLGAEELFPDGMRLTQDDQQMQIATDGEGSLDFTRVAFAQNSHWGTFYDIQDAAAKVLRQDKVADLAAGETLRFATGLCAQPTEGASSFEVARVAEGAAAVALGDERWLAASGPFDAEGISFSGELALIASDRLVLGEATKLSVGGEELLAAETPVSLEVDLAQRKIAVERDAQAASVAWRGEALRVKPGEGLQEFEVATEGIAQALSRAVARLAEAALEAKRALLVAVPQPEYTNIESLTTTEFQVPARRLAVAGQGLFLGLADGSVIALDRDLSAQWQWQAEGPITALASADLDGDDSPEAVVGSEDHYVYALREGEVLWKFEMRAGDHMVPPQQAKMILPADLDADGSVEILAVGPFLHCLRSDGSLAWENYYSFWRGMYRTACHYISVADLNADGKLDVTASFIDGYSGTRTLSHDGTPLMPSSGGFADPHWNHGAPAANIGVDLDGDGRREVIVGEDRGLTPAPFDTGKPFGESVLNCGSVLHLFVGRSAEHDPLIIATNDTCDVRGVYHRTADSGYRLREAWRLNVREAITAAAVFDLDDDGLTEVIVGTKRGNVKVISCEGALLAAADAFRGAVNDLVIVPGRGGPEIAVAREDGSVERLRMRLDL